MNNSIENYYKILDLPAGADLAEIKQAYRDLVQIWHPDHYAHNPRLQQKAEEKLKAINEAYNYLTKYLFVQDRPSMHETQEASKSDSKSEPIKKCPFCGESIPANYNFCTFCRTDLKEYERQRKEAEKRKDTQQASRNSYNKRYQASKQNATNTGLKVLTWAGSIFIIIIILSSLSTLSNINSSQIASPDGGNDNALPSIISNGRGGDIIAPDEIWLKRGDEYYYDRKYGLAISAYKKSIELNPNNSEAYWGRGLSLAKHGYNKSSIEDIRHAAALGHKGASDYLRGSAK